MHKNYLAKGFTLIEVLLALAIIAIALTALLKATSQDISSTEHIKDKTISHWVAMQGVKMIQSGLLPVAYTQEISQVTEMLGERWYWRAKLETTALKSVDKLTIKVSKNQAGPFSPAVIAFKYKS